MLRNFKSYVGLRGCLGKVTQLLGEFDWVPFRDFPQEALVES